MAAGIFAAGLLTLLPAVQRGKARMDQASCTFNLHQLGFSLSQYSGMHGAYPYVHSSSPAADAGMYAVILHDQQLIPDGCATLDCPGNGRSPLKAPLPDFKQISRERARGSKCPACLHHLDYAYNLGYEHPSGHLGPISSALQSVIPLLADNPAHENGQILEGNSPNHGGSGQNVLYSDGHVRWHPTRQIGPLDDDLYLNNRRQAAPGVNPSDSVLAPGNFRFDGKHKP